MCQPGVRKKKKEGSGAHAARNIGHELGRVSIRQSAIRLVVSAACPVLSGMPGKFRPAGLVALVFPLPREFVTLGGRLQVSHIVRCKVCGCVRVSVYTLVCG